MTDRVRLLLVLVGVVLVTSGSAGAAGDPTFPPGWTHAEINVAQNGAPHTLIYDRGRIQQVSPAAVVLLEKDGSVVTVPLSPQTDIRVNGRPATIANVRKRMQAQTLRVDGGAATQLRVTRGGA